MDIITVIIADDHEIFRKGLRTVLNEIPFIKVVAEASNGQDLLNVMKSNPADVVLLDIRMPVMDGIEAATKISGKYPETRIIALTMHEEIGYFNKMIEAGATGFLLKKTNREQLEKAIMAVCNNETYYSEEFIMSTPKTVNVRKSNIILSEREKQVLDLICKGSSNTEIAKELGISQRTVDGHRSRLFDKTGAKNSPNLVMFAIKNNLIST